MKFLKLLLVQVFFFTTTVGAQEYQYKYLFNYDLSSTDDLNAVFIGKGLKENGTIKVDISYKVSGLKLMSAHFFDSTLAMMHGFFQSFHRNQQKETEGNYEMGNEEGAWLKWDTAGKLIDSSIYKAGAKIAGGSYYYDKAGLLNLYQFEDTLRQKYLYKSFDGNKVKIEADINGEFGVLKSYSDDSLIITKNIARQDKKDAEYPGGNAEWTSFIRSNMNPNIPSDNNAPPGTYLVIVRFRINAQGKVDEILPETNFGFGMEKECIRVISNAKNWIPAQISGIPVSAYRKQPMTFVIAVN